MRCLVATLLLMFSLNTCAPRVGQQEVPQEEPGKHVRQEFLRAYNTQDVEAVVALYAEDATLVSDGGTFKGRNEIRKWVKAGVDQGSRLEAIEPSVEKSSGTLAYGTGRTRRLVGSVVHLGQYLIVMERIGGEWKIVQHFSLTAGETSATPDTKALGPRNAIIPCVSSAPLLRRLEENIRAVTGELMPEDLREIEKGAAKITPHGARYPEAIEALTYR